MKKLILVVAALAIVACSKAPKTAAPPVANEQTQRRIFSGDIIGFVTEAGANSWRGISYAQAPVGDLRWRAPQTALGWDDVRTATEFGERCPQVTNYLNASEGLDPGLFIGSEDCLFLDIYAPPNAAGRNLPVMVWIHGGSNVWGRSSSYDGSNLALNEDVVIVAVQYRLGPLGWFSHEWLRGDAASLRDMSANFSILDLIASLEWVEQNIVAFGGNPENVTIFGESAGGHNVAALLASPLASGLFHRAILQSGSFDSVSVGDAENGRDDLINPSSVIVDRLGAVDAPSLRSTPLEALFAAYGWADTGRIILPTIIEDGVALQIGPLRAAFASMDTFNAVPIITGTNRDELKLFHIASDEFTKKFLGFFVVPRDKEFYDAVAEYPSRIWRIRSVDRPAAMMAAAGHDEVYAYRFDWDEGGRFLFSDLKTLLGAAHAMEIPFVFNRFQLLGKLDKIMFQKKTAPAREELSRAMGAYWAAFARNGAPADGDRGLQEWPRWSTGRGSLMRFDTADKKTGEGGMEVIRDVATMDALVSDLTDDERLDQEQRCRVVDAIRLWLDGLADEIDAKVGCSTS